jgi:hypothetical protein
VAETVAPSGVAGRIGVAHPSASVTAVTVVIGAGSAVTAKVIV